MPKKQLEIINEEKELERIFFLYGEEPFSNCRNCASGTLKSLDSSVVAHRKLDNFMYQYISSPVKTQKESLEEIKNLGFKVDQTSKVCENLDEIMEFIPISFIFINFTQSKNSFYIYRIIIMG